ncbi:MAG: transposase, partial [Boseongicola sp.]
RRIPTVKRVGFMTAAPRRQNGIGKSSSDGLGLLVAASMTRLATRAKSSGLKRAAIVAQSYEAGQTVAGVARRHGIAPSQLSGWSAL